MKTIKEFKGGYGRIGKIWVEMYECTICGHEKICIASDASEGEYHNAWFCLTCVEEHVILHRALIAMKT